MRDRCRRRCRCNQGCEEEFIGEENIEDYHNCVSRCGEDDECILDCVYDTIYELCGAELGEAQFVTYNVPNGELHFSVDGFSQYDITDDEDPTVTITSPEDLVYGEETIPESIIFDADGTGSQISSIQVLLNDDLLFELDYFDIYMGEYCTHQVESPDSVSCEFGLPYDEMDDDEYTLTIIAVDFGGEEGNEVEVSVSFVYDTTPPEITIVEPTNTEYYYGQTVKIQTLLIDNLDDDPEFDGCILKRSDNETEIPYGPEGIAFGEEEIDALGEGKYYILTCSLSDHADNEGSTEVHFVVLEDTEEGTDLIPSEEESDYEFDNETTTAILPYANVIETITVPTEVNKTTNLDLSQLIDSDGNARFETGLNLSIERQTNARNYTLVIPDGTVVTPGDEWDGLFQLPEVMTSSNYSVNSGNINLVVELGNDIQLDFSNPVQIVITGVGSGKRAGWTRGNASLNAITTVCDDKDAPTNIPEGGMCYLNANGNMYIWTYHFTEFGVYTPVSSSSVIRRDTCITQWVCSDWGECVDGIQARSCKKEVSYCAIREEMPALTQSCGQASPTPTPVAQDSPTPDTQTQTGESETQGEQQELVEPTPETTLVTQAKTSTLNTAFLALTLLAVVVIIIAIAMFTRKKKE
jgi:hypothetical protein